MTTSAGDPQGPARPQEVPGCYPAEAFGGRRSAQTRPGFPRETAFPMRRNTPETDRRL